MTNMFKQTDRVRYKDDVCLLVCSEWLSSKLIDMLLAKASKAKAFVYSVSLNVIFPPVYYLLILYYLFI